jgi:hypothetical protein
LQLFKIKIPISFIKHTSISLSWRSTIILAHGFVKKGRFEYCDPENGGKADFEATR